MEELTTTAIKRYAKKTIPQLIKIATTHFNLFIRTRDQGMSCISCSSWETAHASHFYSGGNYAALRFDEDNVSASCVKCNTHLHGNLLEYQKRLIKRIGQERVDLLHTKADHYKRTGYKWDRFSLIEIIERYKQKNKGL